MTALLVTHSIVSRGARTCPKKIQDPRLPSFLPRCLGFTGPVDLEREMYVLLGGHSRCHKLLPLPRGRSAATEPPNGLTCALRLQKHRLGLFSSWHSGRNFLFSMFLLSRAELLLRRCSTPVSFPARAKNTPRPFRGSHCGRQGPARG